MFVVAKHYRNQYGIITNNLYAVMLRPLHLLDFLHKSQTIQEIICVASVFICLTSAVVLSIKDVCKKSIEMHRP